MVKKTVKPSKVSFRTSTKQFLGSIIPGASPNFINDVHKKLYSKKSQ